MIIREDLASSFPHAASSLQIQGSAESAWDFVVDKRIEAPETFQAIQTYRATVTLLTQQRAFVKEMNSGEALFLITQRGSACQLMRPSLMG